MINAIKSYVKEKLVNLFSNLYKTYQNETLYRLKSLSNVSIHNSFVKGEGSQFELLHNACKQLRVAPNVNCRKYCNFLLYPTGTLIVHENVFFNNYCSVNCLGHIEIGANSIFGEGVRIYDHNHLHHYTDNRELMIERDEFAVGSVKIGKNCWIGSNVVILKNVEIGDNVIIGANNLIFKSIPSNTVVKLKTEYLYTLNNG